VEVGPATPTGWTTEDGVGVGDPATSIPDRFGISDSEQYFGFDPSGGSACSSREHRAGSQRYVDHGVEIATQFVSVNERKVGAPTHQLCDGHRAR
jgi:hypothetical protein